MLGRKICTGAKAQIPCQRLFAALKGPLFHGRTCVHEFFPSRYPTLAAKSAARMGPPRVSVWPGPVCGFGQVDAMLVRVVAARDLLVQKSLLGVAAEALQLGHTIHNIHGKTEA